MPAPTESPIALHITASNLIHVGSWLEFVTPTIGLFLYENDQLLVCKGWIQGDFADHSPTFPTPFILHPTTRLQLRIYDIYEHTITNDDFMGSCTLLYSELLLAMQHSISIQIPLINHTFPKLNQQLKKYGSSLTLSIKPIDTIESQQIHNNMLDSLTLHNLTNVKINNILQKHILNINIKVKNLPRSLVCHYESILCAGIFEQDIHTTYYKLKGITHRQRGERFVTFQGSIALTHYPGEGQRFQVSIYCTRIPTIVPTNSSTHQYKHDTVTEEQRIGSAYFTLDDLVSSSRRNRDTQVRHFIETNETTTIVGLECSLSHDSNSDVQNQLWGLGTSVEVTVSSDNAAASTAAVQIVDESDIERTNEEQLQIAMKALNESPEKPEAPDDESQSGSESEEEMEPGEVLAKVETMMTEGQLFTQFIGGEGYKVVVEYRAIENGVGTLHWKDAPDSTKTIAGKTTGELALSDIADIWLGEQTAAFGALIDPTQSAQDDGVSFSLVSPGITLDITAGSAKQRAAWILGIMGILKRGHGTM